MSFLSRIFNAENINSSVAVTCPIDYRQLLKHDEYDSYLFDCAKEQIESLQKVINQNVNKSPGFETLLRDIFAMCYKAEQLLEENVEGETHYNILKNLMNEPEWPELRKKTRFNGLFSASSTVAFAQEYQRRVQEMDKQKNKAKEEASRKPRFLGQLKKPVTAGTGGSEKPPDIALVEIERHVAAQNEKLMLWGITPPMLPLKPERVMKLASLLEQHSEFLQFAERIGQLRASLVNMGKAKLRQKGARLRGVTVGNNIVQAVPSELALLVDVSSEAIFYDRALGGKLTIYDYAVKSERKRGSMVIVIDGSGSVRGEKGYIIRGIAVALVQLARIEKRWASVIIFGSKNEQREFVFDPHEKAIADRLVEMATTFYGGDTIFWEPLELAFERLNTKPFRQGDLVLVTDYLRGAEGPLSNFTERFAQAKTKLGFRYFSLFLPSTQWVNDLSWHMLADHVIPLDTAFFTQNPLVMSKFVSVL